MPNSFPVTEKRIAGFIFFPMVLALCGIQTASLMFWTWIAVPMSLDDIYLLYLFIFLHNSEADYVSSVEKDK